MRVPPQGADGLKVGRVNVAVVNPAAGGSPAPTGKASSRPFSRIVVASGSVSDLSLSGISALRLGVCVHQTAGLPAGGAVYPQWHAYGD